ncbi:caveolin [Plakobranchus ocellatus]|uniref:Caveolin n=1 Tax=Plakobranchus ocellatus TaxID=259542 RepID=A0AAV3ZE12_9GAST|nr:caveolin [Plakobranchus ocellatus]
MSGQEYDIDMVNRDPNNLNDHVRVLFEEVLGEPDGAHSINCVWNCAYKCFNGCKGCCYKLMTTICGIPLAVCWGCEFAYITFLHVWYITPCMRAYMINCGCMQKFYGTCLQCFCQPLFEAFGYCFSNIRVTNYSG